MAINMTAPHARWPQVDDAIFAIAGRAKEAIEEYGKDIVTDATIGALVNDQGELICMKTVYEELKGLPNAKIAAYATIAGQPDFLEAVKVACFREYAPKAYTRAVATPGGSGALKLAVWNYSSPGEDLLVPDWYWSPYKTIAEEGNRGIRNYQLFNDNGGFNIDAFQKNFEELIEKQKNVLTIINSPAHNPTGYSLTDEEWDQVLEIMKKSTIDRKHKAILFVDVAYLDFAGEGMERRKFFTKFSNLPENILVIVGYSMSKGYTMYGLRSGAAIGISSSEEVAREFYYACVHCARANWSNGNRGAMEVMTAIANDAQKLAAYEEEKQTYKALLQTRAAAFVKAAKEVDLEILPYRDGFFVSIPHKKPEQVVEALTKHHLYLVSLGKGIRFAVCAVSEEKCAKAPAIIKMVMDELK